MICFQRDTAAHPVNALIARQAGRASSCRKASWRHVHLNDRHCESCVQRTVGSRDPATNQIS
jgi:hypothetical protein